MDEVQKFVSQNQYQLGYIMQEASRQWVQNDPVGALTVGTCKAFIDKYGEYHALQEKVEMLEKQWYLLKIELEQRREFEERCNGEDEINLIDDIDSIMQKLESGDYFK